VSPILVKPFLGCNMNCTYCYESGYRKAHDPEMSYDLDAIFRAIDGLPHARRGIGLHGGEPLCLPKPDAERILAKSLEVTGKSLVQTNGTLIDDEWIEIFKRNKTHVGISCDGPGELNRFRMSLSMTKQLTEAIIKLKKAGIGVSVISVLSIANVGTPERLAAFKSWLLELRDLQIGGRLNPCSMGNNLQFELAIDDLAEVYRNLTWFCMEHGLTWSPISDLAVKVNGGHAVCSFEGCDVYHTDSAVVILGDGTITNCMRTNDSSILLRHPSKYPTRSEVLQSMPQKYGGCKECPYWNYCNGGCPSTAIDGDWRNRTYLCQVWKAVIEILLNSRKLLLHKIGGNHGDTGNGKGRSNQGHTDSHRDTPHRDTGG